MFIARIAGEGGRGSRCFCTMTQRVTHAHPRAYFCRARLRYSTIASQARAVPELLLLLLRHIKPAQFIQTEKKTPVSEVTMMYYRILASFCLLGMANSQSINPLKACLTEDQTLKIECEFTKGKQTTTPICTFEVDRKIVATTNNISKPVDPKIKNPGQASLEENKCVLTWAAFSEDQGKMYNCTIHYEAPTTLGIKVEKKETSTCSAGNTLMHGGAILLLAFVLPVLSGLL